MENLSSNELSLLLDIYREPNQRLSMYGHRLRVPYSQVLLAQNDLLCKNLIFEQNSGRLIINLTEIEEQNLKIILENGQTPDVAPVEAPKPLETETVSKLQKFEDVEAKVFEMLKASPLGRTAKELAAPFGTKGTSLQWTLRKMINEQKIVKRDVKYFVAEECDKVVNVPIPPADERREVSTDLEIRTFILQQDGSFTQNELYDSMSKTYKIDKNKFCEIFTDLVLDGYYNVHDGEDFVQHALDFSPDNKHERCANVSSAEGIAELMNDFVSAWEKFDLQTAVRETGLRHDRIIKYLSGAGWNVADTKNIHKGKSVSACYTKFEDIDVNEARQLVFGIVKLDAFIKRFNLDPNTKFEVVKLLELVKVAQYDEASGFLGPVKVKPKEEEPEEIRIETSGTVKLDTEYTEVVGDNVIIKEEQNGIVVTKAEIPLADLNAISTASDSITILPKEEIGTKIQNEEDADEAEPETIIKTDKGFASGFLYDTRFQLDLAAPVEQPTHIDNRSSPLYGHKILGTHVEMGTYSIDPNPDFVWMAAQPDATEQEKALGLLTRESMLEILKRNYPHRHIVVDEVPQENEEPTPEPQEEWKEQESPDVFGRDPEPQHPEPESATLMEMVRGGFELLSKSQILERLAEALNKPANEAKEEVKKSFAELELPEVDTKDEPEHDLRKGPIGPTGPIGPDPRSVMCSACGNPLVREKESVNPQWTMTLLMLAERFQHEHQYTTAQILRDIHDHLAPK